MVLEQNVSLVKKVNRLLNWGHWFSFFNILLALIVTSAYWLAEPAPSSVIGWTYLALNWIGHTAFLCFLFFILTIFPVSLIFPYQRHVRGIAAAIATSAFVVLIFDAYVYNNLGYHIGAASFEQTIDLLRQQIVTNLRNFIIIVMTVAALLFALQLTLSNFCWKKIERLKQSGLAQPLMLLFVGSFMLSHIVHIYADANLKWDVTKQDNVLPLSYPATAKTFLARYQLVDLTKRAQRQLDKMSVPDTFQANKTLQCNNTAAGKSTLLIISRNFNAAQQQFFQAKYFKPLEQHFAPVQTTEALVNLLYGQFYYNAANSTVLKTAPAWLAQLSEQKLTIARDDSTEFLALPWLTATKNLNHYAIVFDDHADKHWANYDHFDNILIMQLVAQHEKFTLAPTVAWTNWKKLLKLQHYEVSQHLDLLPTLLAQAGCSSEHSWLGDNLLQPSKLPKLLISGQEIISFKKDKMVILREDGSYGVWSAGTLLPLTEKLDLPMLTDALKRIEHEK
ncbi:DUF3413 domain-containing protein [Rheinheimera sp. MMS21-TC3]|uniref:DUF3413 domain-containing protein n=1 Tax=Rheinheimera sp. MMS21-TC3 TaxID=3072790 RepID=UPI0028C4B392|nr:DUF3413 domain-containing protein [Rheinheimera sp. MMS21-TC3]WNO60815.1 DUF3413 domain-containing protein [Rheinheimera sp. MMS21-TC3]